MRRGFVLQVRDCKFKDSTDNICAVVIGQIPDKMKDGKLFYPNSTKCTFSAYANETKEPELFARFKKIAVGSIVDFDFVINSFNKTIVSPVVVVTESPFSDSDLYDRKNGK